MSDVPPYTLSADALTLRLRVQPGARSSSVLDVQDGRLRLRLHAQPVEGAANTALVEFLALLSGVPESSVRILSGHTSRNKLVRIETPDAGAALSRLRAGAEAT